MTPSTPICPARPSDATGAAPAATDADLQRAVHYEHSLSLAPLLEQLRVTLLVSTYQAGKAVAIGTHRGALVQSFHNFDRPMGIAVQSDSIAVAARNQIWFLRNAPDIAQQVEPAGRYGACYLTRTAQVTGEIQAHELGWSGAELWVVNTAFSCLCTLDARYSFVPRWCPPFISALAPEDRCHLNGIAMQNGRPKYVTAMAATDSAGGWRPNKVTSGCLIDVDSGATVAHGFAMPHSPRVHRGQTWLLDSGRGRVVWVDPKSEKVETAARVPGYARGLAFAGPYAFVGLSKIRATSTFDGVPIAEQRDRLKCGVAVVDLQSGKLLASFEFKSGVDEIFDVAVLPNVWMAAIRGPFADKEGDPAIWTVPEQARELTGPPGSGVARPL
ncbi:MAG: TIGR03032 family protein [Planctomycetes bacterium RBG_16_64_10]|nr:MAG: TIGR03032 family protein [Planctomycetes bacterium RBG_16_64_10]